MNKRIQSPTRGVGASIVLLIVVGALILGILASYVQGYAKDAFLASQANTPLTIRTIDNTVSKTSPSELIFPNGALTGGNGSISVTLSGGGGGTPGGSNTQVQYNNAGAFGGITGAITNGTALTLVAPVLGTPASVTLTNATGLPPATGIVGWPANASGVLTNNGSGTLSWAASSGANTALSNLASVAINTDLLPASGQSLGNASFPFLSAFIGNTTQYESVAQSAGLVTHSALGSAANIGWNWAPKGTGLFKITSPTSSGAAVFEIRPVSGNSFTRINDNGTMVIDSDVATGSVPFNVKYNGATILNLPASGNLDMKAMGVAGGIFTVDSSGTPALNSNALSFKLGTSGNVGMKYNTAGVAEINNGTAGQWGSILVGVRDAGTTTVVAGVTLGHQSTGTPAAGLGSAVLFNINSTTSADQNAAQLAAVWTTATHATRTADVVISTVNSGAALAESFRAKANGDAVSQGNLVAAVAGKGLQLQSGTGARAGNAVLVGGMVTVSSTTVTANTLVLLTRKTSGGTIGTSITYTLSAGNSFTITSDNILDTSTFTYMLVELN